MYLRIALLLLPCLLSWNLLSARQIAFDAIFETCQTFLHHLRHGDEESAYFYTTSCRYKGTVSLEAFRKFTCLNPSLRSSESLLIGTVTQDNDTASLEGMILDARGDAFYILFELEKESQRFGINKVSLMKPAYSFQLAPNCY